MKYSIYSIVAAGVVWMGLFSTLRADSRASIEIVGVKLTDKNQITVEFEETNILDKNMNIYPQPLVRLASLKGEYYVDDPALLTIIDDYRPVITIYADLLDTHPDGSRSAVLGNWPGNLDYGMYSHLPPLILKPGESKNVSVVIDMQFLLARDFMSTLSKNIWVRVGLYQSTGEPTQEENQDLFKQYYLLTREQYAQFKEKLLKKYAPKEFTHGDLYKLEKPKEGESNMVLETIKAPF